MTLYDMRKEFDQLVPIDSELGTTAVVVRFRELLNIWGSTNTHLVENVQNIDRLIALNDSQVAHLRQMMTGIMEDARIELSCTCRP